MLTRERFSEFFGACNDGRPPFAWQIRLLDHLLDHGRWPQAITAPTGAGKTSAIDVHVFCQALMRVGAAPRLPRRLVVTVNRRSIVDSHLQRAERLQTLLSDADEGILAEVAEALRDGASTEPLSVVGMRGGLPTDRAWLDDPVSCMVVLATPDMWGSRLLFRGYGTSRLARPREAGLLALDSVVVIDEAHLNRQLEATAREVGAMVGSVPALRAVPPLQVVTTTATPDEHGMLAVGVEAADLTDPADALTRRLTAPKWLEYVASAARPGTAAHYAAIADLASGAVPEGAPGSQPSTVLCVLNTVAGAIEVHDRIAAERGADRVAIWVGRMRPHDLRRLRREHPGLFTVEGDPEIDVLVTTQTVEVGVDIDCAALVTELAPGSALAQRAGRVNRLGRLTSSRIVVVGPQGSPRDAVPPYGAADLRRAHEWLTRRGSDGVRVGGNGNDVDLDGGRFDVSPWALRDDAPPAQEMERAIISHLTPARAAVLAETTLDHAYEDDLTFWLRDSLDADSEPIGLVVRDPLPRDDADAMALLAAVPIDDAEIFPATIHAVRQLLPGILGDENRPRAFLVRSGELTGVLRAEDDGVRLTPFAQLSEAQTTGGFLLHPGDVLVLDHGHEITRAGVVTADPSPVRERIDPLWGAPEKGIVVAVRDPLDGSVDAIDDSQLALLEEIEALREELDEEGSASAETLQAALAERRQESLRLVLPPLVGETPLAWAVVMPVDVVNADPVTRETWSVSRAAVTLVEHQSAVAARAQAIGHACGLPEELVAVLDLAGAHHDDGKADARFQRGTLGAAAGEALAKGVWRSPQEARRAAVRHDLPPGWRHEQASVVHAAASLPDDELKDLILRLVGTSHGHGRPFFPHGSATLVGHDADPDFRERAWDLYGAGAGWSDIIDRTHRDFGLWGAAYLEALLRAADCTVSKEGS